MSIESTNIDTASKVFTPMSPDVSSPPVETPVKTGKTAQAHVITPLAQSSPKASVEHVAGEAFDQLHRLASSSDEEGFKAGQGKLAAEVVKVRDGKVEARNHWTSVAGRVFLKILTLTIVFAPLALTLLSRSEAAHNREMDQLDKLGSAVGSMTQESAKEAARAGFQKNCVVLERSVKKEDFGVASELVDRQRISNVIVQVGDLQVPRYINDDILRAPHIRVSVEGQASINFDSVSLPGKLKPAIVGLFCEDLVSKLGKKESDQCAKNIAGNILALGTQNAAFPEAKALTKDPVLCTGSIRDNVVRIGDDICHQTVMILCQFLIPGNDDVPITYKVVAVERQIPMDVMRASSEDLASGKVKMDGMSSVAAHSPTFDTEAEALAYMKQASEMAKNGPLIK